MTAAERAALGIFGKGERANLSKAEVNELRKVLANLAAEYRKGMGSNVKSGS